MQDSGGARRFRPVVYAARHEVVKAALICVHPPAPVLANLENRDHIQILFLQIIHNYLIVFILESDSVRDSGAMQATYIP